MTEKSNQKHQWKEILRTDKNDITENSSGLVKGHTIKCFFDLLPHIIFC